MSNFQKISLGAEKIEIEKNGKKEESNKIIFNEYINLTDNINNNKNYKKKFRNN